MNMLPDKDKVGRAVTTAVIAGGVSKLMDPRAMVRIPYLNQSYPLWTVSAGCGAGASLCADYMHDIAIPSMDKSLFLEESGSTALALTAGGAGFAATTSLLDQRLLQEQGGMWRVAATGAACVGMGHWAYGQMADMMV